MTKNSQFVAPPPEANPLGFRVLQRVKQPLERFMHIEAASGILLLLVAACAMFLANSAWAESYFHWLHFPVGFRWGDFMFERPLEWVVNDGLMTIFFFVVGLEIRREVHHGELSELRRAALPVFAALGGMIAPALIYLAFASSPQTHSGWGVPVATDIAFAVGVLMLLGKRIPAALRVLLLALAVIDDLGAILVIALFYSAGIQWSGIALCIMGLALTFALQKLGVRNKAIYIAPAIVAWAGTYISGVHPTIAGVVIGLVTPVRVWHGVEEHSPSEKLIQILHPWVAFLIMPLFAFFNAGVALGSVELSADKFHVFSGVGLGLLVGKPIGVLAACWLSMRAGIAQAPRGIGVRQLLVLGFVAGIGFTMSLFIAHLAFNDAELLAAAKLGVLAGSLIAGCIGLMLGRFLLRPYTPDVAASADQAEASTRL